MQLGGAPAGVPGEGGFKGHVFADARVAAVEMHKMKRPFPTRSNEDVPPVASYSKSWVAGTPPLKQELSHSEAVSLIPVIRRTPCGCSPGSTPGERSAVILFFGTQPQTFCFPEHRGLRPGPFGKFWRSLDDIRRITVGNDSDGSAEAPSVLPHWLNNALSFTIPSSSRDLPHIRHRRTEWPRPIPSIPHRRTIRVCDPSACSVLGKRSLDRMEREGSR